jgi:outer membrane protein assembly factor BamB
MRATRRHLLRTLMVVLPLVFSAADWTQFRGPDGSGIAAVQGLPTTWDTAKGIVWKTPLPGYGASSPMIFGDRVYLTYYTGYGLNQDDPGNESALRQHVLCVNLADGQTLWDKSLEPTGPVHEYRGFQALHGYASSTLTTDGQSLYNFFGRSGVGAMSLDGAPQWRTSVGEKTHGWGSGTSPVLYKNLVIVNASVESGSLVAIDKTTGSEAWRAGGINAAWSTPVLVRTPSGSTEVIVSVKGQLQAFDPDTGKKLWWCESFDDYVCPSAIAHDGVVYAIGARKNSAVAVRAGGRGDVTETHRLWKIRKGSNVSSPLYHDGHLYWVHETRGTAYCVDAKTGATVYEERMTPRPGRIYASPVMADGKIYVVSREKGTFILAARPEFELLAHVPPLDESIFNGSPAVTDGKLLIRSDKFLYCIGQ